MGNPDTDRLELLERQLSEKVTERVRAALFKVYATVGVAVIFVIGFVSWDIVGDIKQELKAKFIAEIEEDIDSAITTKDFTQFPNKKPRPGVLELWVDLPRTTVQQQAF